MVVEILTIVVFHHVSPWFHTVEESHGDRTVVGTYFDWLIRLDYGAEGKLRLVYEQATPTNEVPVGRGWEKHGSK